jgi:lysozyme
MKLSNNGAKLIKGFEGLRLSAYRDIAGILTIGYGSTRYQNGKMIKPGDKLTNEQQASALFTDTLKQYEDAVNNYVEVPLTQNQFDALVSFTYNEDTGALKSSTLLKKLNQKDNIGAACELLRWTKITEPQTGAKRESHTLKQRREAERQLFLSAPAISFNKPTQPL